MSNVKAEELKQAWSELSQVLDSLPPEQRDRLQGAFITFLHDTRSAMGIVTSAESLLRRTYPADSPDVELLDMVRTSTRKAITLLTDMATTLKTQK